MGDHSRKHRVGPARSSRLSSRRPRNANSPFILPSTALALIVAVGWGSAPGTSVSSNLLGAMLLALPTLVWSGSWLVPWDGDPAFPERKMIVCGVACILAVSIYVFATIAYLLGR